MKNENTKKLSPDEVTIMNRLVKAFDSDDIHSMDSALSEIALLRQHEMFEVVNAKAVVLQKNIKEFLSGSNFLGLTEEELPDAMDRLKHVIKMTDEAAHTTIDGTEDLREEIDSIRKITRIGKLEGVQDEDKFLDDISVHLKASGSMLNDILLAQSYQDLSGQMIKKVLMLIEDVQDNLIDLMIMIGDIKPNIDQARMKPVDRLPLSGPSLPNDFNVVDNQDDVDDLFDSLN